MTMRLLAAGLLMLLPWQSGHPGGHAPLAAYSFALSLMTGFNNELFTLFTVKEFEGKEIGIEPLTRGQFVMQAQGVVPSKANPMGENLFRKHGVARCLPPPALDDGKRPVQDCDIFDELWKLRFWEYPFKQGEGMGKGWAESPYAPSARQMLLLSSYGITSLHGKACGEEAFRLLHDVGDTAWVDNYRSGY